ncbi:hypothetical protein FSC37_11985 [Piscinibacter aquaticus]|uniref:GAF domain-containing protein n=1 Tax=Piscinibacter aquaticus TaxID=392597 RepID=A0A5C6U3M8_9BURK|nr:hypothetical protein FSC37_11985 [Piscinibacter aquaticus]
MNLFEHRFGSRELEVVISDLLVATAESSDALLDDSVSQVLRMLRQSMGLDVVFVSEFVDGRRVFRFVDAEGSAPLRPGSPRRWRKPTASVSSTGACRSWCPMWPACPTRPACRRRHCASVRT